METPETLNETVSGDKPGNASQECEETVIVVSDQHLGEGRTLRYQRKLSLVKRFWHWLAGLFAEVEGPPIVDVSNPLEDFPFDELFVAFIDKTVEKYGASDTLRFMLMGDCFDPLAVTYFGKFEDPRYEAPARYKMKKIIRGHPAYFDKLAEVIRRPNVRLDIFAGNHDLFLVWPAVQRLIIRRLAGNDAALSAKIRFIDHHARFELLHRGVLYCHGMHADPQNTVDPDDTIREKNRFGVKLKRPELAVPPGSVMAVEVAASIKMRNFLVGRADKPSMVWKNASLHRWGWVVITAAKLFWFFLSWSLRRKGGLGMTLKMIFATIHDDSVDKLAEKMLRDREGIRAVVLGHSHERRRITTERGTYVNTGTWALTYRIIEPTFTHTWKRFRWLEFNIFAIYHFLRTGKLPFARQLTKLLGFVALAGSLTTFLFMSVPKAWRLGSYHVGDFKLSAGILLAFVLVTGLIRIFSVKPKIEQMLTPTFGLIRHFRNGDLKVELMEFDAKESLIRECV